MASIKRFEDLESWKGARALVQEIYTVSSNGRFSRDLILRDQIRRAAISMMANIAEGFSRRSNREFAQFLFVAKASAAETQSHLYVALDQGYLNEKQFRFLYERTESYARQVSALITYLLRGKGPTTQQTQKTQ